MIKKKYLQEQINDLQEKTKELEKQLKIANMILRGIGK